MHRYLLHNGQIHDTCKPLLSPGQVGFLNGWGVFSTLRVSEGVLFAYERHYDRMKRDAARMRVPFEFTAADLRRELQKLIEANDAYEATLRVSIVRNKGGLFETPDQNRETDLVAFTANLRAWGAGVKLGYVADGRYGASPFAGTKVTSWAQNLTWYEEAHERGLDEVILLNEHGEVSECTSANIFIVEGTSVSTPPVRTSGCLPGVTRALLLEEIQVPGLAIGEREITPSELEAADEVFITSTTRDLLPVFEVDGAELSRKFDVMERLRRAFVDYRVTYISENVHRKQRTLA